MSGVAAFLTRRRGGRFWHWTDIVTWLWLAGGLVVMFGPAVWLVGSSFKTPAQLAEFPPTILPYVSRQVTVEGYDKPLNLYTVTLPDGLSKVLAEVRRIGINTVKNSPDFLMVVFFTSPDNRLDIQYISNYVTLQVLDRIARLNGVGQAQAFGGRDYNMRIWIDPGLAAARDMTIDEVVNAIRAQNVQVAAGAVASLPMARQARHSNSAFRPRAA